MRFTVYELNPRLFKILFLSFVVGKRSSARPFVASCLAFSTFRDDIFMLGGQDAVVVWTLNEDTRKLSQTTVTLGKVKRNITNLLVSKIYFYLNRALPFFYT